MLKDGGHFLQAYRYELTYMRNEMHSFLFGAEARPPPGSPPRSRPSSPPPEETRPLQVLQMAGPFSQAPVGAGAAVPISRKPSRPQSASPRGLHVDACPPEGALAAATTKRAAQPGSGKGMVLQSWQGPAQLTNETVPRAAGTAPRAPVPPSRPRPRSATVRAGNPRAKAYEGAAHPAAHPAAHSGARGTGERRGGVAEAPLFVVKSFAPDGPPAAASGGGHGLGENGPDFVAAERGFLAEAEGGAEGALQARPPMR